VDKNDSKRGAAGPMTYAVFVPLYPVSEYGAVVWAVTYMFGAWKGLEAGSTSLERLVNRLRYRAEADNFLRGSNHLYSCLV
jgi:hypothetical protein